MDLNSKAELLDLRSSDPALVRKEEDRLCGIINSEQASPEEKYQALIDLASISGLDVRGLADAA